MKLSQLVRDRLNEITQWRSIGESWLEIEGRFRAMGQDPGTDSVRTLYRLELARRRSPEREAALKWANRNYQAIRDLLSQGYDWTAILILIPPNFDTDPGSSGITKLVSEFMSIDRLRSKAQEPSSRATGSESLLKTDPHPALQEVKSLLPPAQTKMPRINPKPGTILTTVERLELTPR